MAPSYAVVDGSNIATEGRSVPSLAQLDEAVRQFQGEFPEKEIIVVVDATFGHRIDPSERKAFDEAVAHAELVSPPAGAVGRGDAFLLRVAERVGAQVLSNDSFQEFHAEHPWLFDRDRLVGGKPVPGVGWIFTPRTPVRGPRSRQVTGKAKKEDRAAELPAPVKAAELAKAARKVSARRSSDGAAPTIGDVRDAAAPKSSAKPKKAATPKMAEPVPVSAPKPPAKKGSDKKHAKPSPAELAAAAAKPAKKTKVDKAAKATKKAKAEAPKTEKATRATKAAKAAGAAGRKAKAAAPPAEAAAKATKAAKAAKTAKAAKATAAQPPATKRAAAGRGAATAAQAPSKVAEIAAVGRLEPATATPSAGARTAKRARRRSVAGDAPVTALDPEVLEAINEATAEALSPPSPKAMAVGKAGKDEKGGGKGAKRRRSAPPLPAVNEPLPFIGFVAAYPLGSEVEGEVASFTSHGAMVEVWVPDGESLHCYIPLAGLGDPPPRKAREVLTRGQRRTFVLVGLDPPRRVAELALPGVTAELAVSAGG